MNRFMKPNLDHSIEDLLRTYLRVCRVFDRNIKLVSGMVSGRISMLTLTNELERQEIAPLFRLIYNNLLKQLFGTTHELWSVSYDKITDYDYDKRKLVFCIETRYTLD